MAIVFRGWGAFASGTTSASAAAATGATSTDVHIGIVGNKPYTSTPTATNFTGGQISTAAGAIANGNGLGSPRVTSFYKTGATAALNAAVTSGSPTMARQCSVYSDNGTLDTPVGSGGFSDAGTEFFSTSGTLTEGFNNNDLVVVALATGNDTNVGSTLTMMVDGVTQTVTWETKNTTTSGNDGAIYYGRFVVSGITNGATDWILSGTATPTTLTRWTTGLVRIRESGTSLAPAAAAHAQTAQSPTLTQVHNLTVQNAAQAQVAQSPTLTQQHTLVVQGASHAQAASSPTLAEVRTVTPNPAAHAQTAGNVALTQVHNLTVQSAAHAQTAQQKALTQTHVLAVQPAAHAQAATSPGTFAQFTQVTPNSAAHAQAATSPTLTQQHMLAVANARSLQAAGNVALTQVHTLVVANAHSLQAATSPSLAQTHILSPQNAVHLQSAGNVKLTLGNEIDIAAVQPAAHLQTATSPTLVEVKTLTVAGASHAQVAQSPVLTVTHPIAQVFSARHGQRAGEVTLVQNSTLQVESARHAQEAGTIRLEQWTEAWRFRGPIEGSIAFHADRLVARLGVPGGVTLLVSGGVVVEAQYPTVDQIAAADVAYIGGHEYVISPQAAQVLDAAGYGAYLEATQVLQEV